jgi:hypothetical protein
MFCRNNAQQISLTDPLNNMPKYLKEILEKSWANSFQQHIFPNINEGRFSVIYSDNYASRPNSPVNVIIGLLILKEIFQLSDEELIGSLHFDIRYQYALRTTSYEKQPVSINTLTNFRNRLVEYEKLTGIDLIQLEVESQAEYIAKFLKVDNKKVRMDSLMVSSSCKKLTRLELVYNVNSKFVKALSKINADLIPEECKVYLEKGHKNETIYRTRDIETESKLQFLLNQSQILYNTALKIGEKITDLESCKLLSRMIKEQLSEDETGTVSPKLGSKISPESLQNPTDSDATYRTKYGPNIGYVANVAESFNDKNSVITNYDLKPNIYSDSKFADDVIEKLISKVNDKSSKIQLLVDGAYYGHNKAEDSLSKGIEIIPSELVGRKPSKEKLSYTSFSIDEETNVINRCAYGKKPTESYFSSSSYTAKFDIEQCSGCPYQSNCPIKHQKKYNVVRVSEKRYQTDLQREKMNTAEYIKLTNKRAGIEGIPSVLRRRYKIDTIPVRGLLRSKLWVGFKIAAYNFKKLLKQLLKDGYYEMAKLILFIINILCNISSSLFHEKRNLLHILTDKRLLFVV